MAQRHSEKAPELIVVVNVHSCEAWIARRLDREAVIASYSPALGRKRSFPMDQEKIEDSSHAAETQADPVTPQTRDNSSYAAKTRANSSYAAETRANSSYAAETRADSSHTPQTHEPTPVMPQRHEPTPVIHQRHELTTFTIV